MSFLYPAQPRRISACFASPDSKLPLLSDSPCLLWSRDRALGAKLLEAIAGEAANRKLPFFAVYDPLLPDRMTALTVEGIGSYTLFPDALTREGGMIDCSVCVADEKEPAELTSLRKQQECLRTQISRIGKILAAQNRLRKETASLIIDKDALTARAIRIARHIPKGNGSSSVLPILSYGEQNGICLYPFDSDTRIIGLTSRYNLADLFLDALSDALAQKRCGYTVLTDALTDTPIGIYLTQIGVCYLTEAPTEVREKQLTLQRFLNPYTTEGRRAWRQLTASFTLLEEHLCDRIRAYRELAQQEEKLFSALYQTNRLQNFRKRLLIDLFCKGD